MIEVNTASNSEISTRFKKRICFFTCNIMRLVCFQFSMYTFICLKKKKKKERNINN